jgi:GNAT superfamily N-acetyltransferase
MNRIRPATESDARLLARLRYEFRSAKEPVKEDENTFRERCENWMRERLCKPASWKCWIAESDGAAVGNLWLQLIEKIPNPGFESEYHAYITNVFVREDSRRRGVGSKLLEAAVDWLQSEDVHCVFLWSTGQGRELYLRHGFSTNDELLERIIHHLKS